MFKMSTPTNQGTMFLVRYACVLAALALSCASARKNTTRRLSEAARRLSPLLNPNPTHRRLPEEEKCEDCGGKEKLRRKRSNGTGKKKLRKCHTCDGTGDPPQGSGSAESAQDLDFVKCGECSDTGEMQYNDTTKCLEAGRMNKVMRLAHYPFCGTGCTDCDGTGNAKKDPAKPKPCTDKTKWCKDCRGTGRYCTIIPASTGATMPCTHCAVKVSVPGCEDMSGVYIRKSVSDPECAPEEWRRCRSKFFYLNEKSGWCVRQISTRYWNICTRWTNAYISKAPSGEVPTKNSRKQGWEACDHLCDCGMRVRPSYQRNAAGYPVPRWPARCKNPECGRLHEGWITLKPRFPEPTVELINDFDHPKLFKKEPTLP